jgi:hypothetical protein
MLAVAIILTFIGCARIVNENVKDTDKSMEMSYDKFSGTKTRSVILAAGTVVAGDINTNDGALSISVVDESGNIAYKGKHISTNSFSLMAVNDSVYTIRIVGNNHNGSYKLLW